MSALHGDRDAVMKTLGDTIRALDAPDQWRILATTLSALEEGERGPWVANMVVSGPDHEVRWIPTSRQWRYMERT